MKIEIPISLGELYDKVSILEIKESKIKDKKKLTNITSELNKLKVIVKKYPIDGKLYDELKSINEALWKIEDEIREYERAKDFGDEFIKLARSVYFANDNRSEIKKKINIKYSSEIVEEKSYEKY